LARPDRGLVERQESLLIERVASFDDDTARRQQQREGGREFSVSARGDGPILFGTGQRGLALVGGTHLAGSERFEKDVLARDIAHGLPGHKQTDRTSSGRQQSIEVVGQLVLSLAAQFERRGEITAIAKQVILADEESEGRHGCSSL